MLYLLRSWCSKGTLLKVGYASNLDRRLNQYRSHNPGVELLESKEGDFLDEMRMHMLLRASGYAATTMNEWYEDKKEIIDLFMLSSDEVKSKLWELRGEVFSDSRFYLSQSKDRVEIYKELLDLYGKDIDYSSPDCNEFDKTCYYKYMLEGEDIGENIKLVLQDFYGLTQFIDRMKLVCTVDLDEYSFGIFINRIPGIFKLYFDYLGPDKCKTFGYQKSRLEAEYSRIYSNQFLADSMIDNIYEVFLVNERYTSQFIKDKLGSIYKIRI